MFRTQDTVFYWRLRNMSMNGSGHIVAKIDKNKLERLSIIKYAFENAISKYGPDVEWDIRANFPPNFKIFTNEEIKYINDILGFDLEYHFGIFKAIKKKKRDAKSNYELR